MIKSIDNNIPSDKYGIAHFHIAAELGHFEILTPFHTAAFLVMS